MTELKPCPFCGNKDDGKATSFVFTRERVRCQKCGAEGPGGDTQEEFIAAWNKRVKEGEE